MSVLIVEVGGTLNKGDAGCVNPATGKMERCVSPAGRTVYIAAEDITAPEVQADDTTSTLYNFYPDDARTFPVGGLAALTWVVSLGRYRSTQGQLISPAAVRVDLDKSLRATAEEVSALGDQLRAGDLSLEEWRIAMKAEIKNVHLRAAALARGGWEQMDQAAYGRVGQIVRSEYGYLEGWVSEIQAGRTLDGRLMSRGALYMQASRGTFHRVQAEEMIKAGIDEERNQLHPAEHCLDCLAQTDLGWVPLGTLTPVGSRECGRNCRCTISYRQSEAAA